MKVDYLVRAPNNAWDISQITSLPPPPSTRRNPAAQGEVLEEETTTAGEDTIHLEEIDGTTGNQDDFEFDIITFT